MKEIWQKLMEKWAKVAKGKVDKVCYQTPRRVEKRLLHFIEHCVPVLKDRKVLEIGCNAGFFGYNIDKVSSSYIGVEPSVLISRKKAKGVDYYKQAQITLKEMSKNAKFVNATVSQFCSISTYDYDSLVMCFVLYHLKDKEIELLKTKILPKCKVAVIQNRVQERPTKHNSYKFWKTNNIKKFFEAQGFTVEVIKAGKFDEIICKKPEKKLSGALSSVNLTDSLPKVKASKTIDVGDVKVNRDDFKGVRIKATKKSPVKKQVKKAATKVAKKKAAKKVKTSFSCKVNR